jgi:hypothetical protein
MYLYTNRNSSEVSYQSPRLAKNYAALESCYGRKFPQMPYQTGQVDLALIRTKLYDICVFDNEWKRCQVTGRQCR